MDSILISLPWGLLDIRETRTASSWQPERDSMLCHYPRSPTFPLVSLRSTCVPFVHFSSGWTYSYSWTVQRMSLFFSWSFMPLPPLSLRLFSIFFVLSVYAQVAAQIIGQNDSSIEYSAYWRTSTHDGQPFRLVDEIGADIYVTLPSEYSRCGSLVYQYI